MQERKILTLEEVLNLDRQPTPTNTVEEAEYTVVEEEK